MRKSDRMLMLRDTIYGHRLRWRVETTRFPRFSFSHLINVHATSDFYLVGTIFNSMDIS